MATINSKDVVDDIIENDGLYPGDHVRVVKIVQYENTFNGGIAYGCIYEGHDLESYSASPFIRNPKTIWEYKK